MKGAPGRGNVTHLSLHLSLEGRRKECSPVDSPFLTGNISLAGCHSWLSRGVMVFEEVKNPAIFSSSLSKTKQKNLLGSLQDEKQPPQVGEVNKVTCCQFHIQQAGAVWKELSSVPG